jgi:hypothetical protein
MAMRRTAPFLVAAVLALLAVLGSSLRAYDVAPHVICSYALAEMDRPTPDVLLIGNSRTGAAIDPVYVTGKVREQTGKEIAIERITLTGPLLPQFALIMQEYARNRGIPQQVFLQLIYNRDPVEQRKVDAPLFGLRDIAYGNLADMVAVQHAAQLNEYDTAMPRQFQQGYSSITAVALTKVTTNIYSSLRYYFRSPYRPIPRCEGDYVFQQSVVWPYGQITDGKLDFGTQPTVKEKREWREIVSHYLPLDPSRPERRFENDQLHKLIAFLEGRGAKVYLVAYPQFAERLPAAHKQAILREFPEATLIDGYQAFEAEVGEGHADYFRDPNHLNYGGARIISRLVAQRIAADVK